MQLFLDSSVILAACGSASGASRAIFDLSKTVGWLLITSEYVMDEVEANLSDVSDSAAGEWLKLRGRVRVVPSVFALNRPVVFLKSKDRPVLLSAYVWANTLITLDTADFQRRLGDWFYHLDIETPESFLIRERKAGRLGPRS